MFVQTEETPNPNSLKFILDDNILQNSSVTYIKAEQNQPHSNFSQDIFKINGVTSVFVQDNFITISKEDSETWEILKPQILSIIMDYKASNKSIEESDRKKEERIFSSEIEKEIYDLIEDRVSPAVAMDGGNIEFIKFDEESGTVYVQMMGSCSGCPSSSATLKDGIKRMLEHYIPEVKDVVNV